MHAANNNPVKEPTAEELERINEINAFLVEYKLAINKKKMRHLISLTRYSFDVYKFGVIIAACCRVSIYT